MTIEDEELDIDLFQDATSISSEIIDVYQKLFMHYGIASACITRIDGSCVFRITATRLQLIKLATDIAKRYPKDALRIIKNALIKKIFKRS